MLLLRTRLIKAMGFCSGATGMRCIGIVCAVMLTLNYLLFLQSKPTTPITDEDLHRNLRFAGLINSSSNNNEETAYILGPFETDEKSDKSAEDSKATSKPSYNKVLKQGQLDEVLDQSVDTAAARNEEPAKDLPSCPEKPANLIGTIKTYLDPISMPEVEAKYPQVRIGGHYRPSDCKAKQKLAIIIPCRNRDFHLAILLHNLVGFLIKQQLDFSIYVIDQEEPTTFNRGMLFNIGFMEALKRGEYTCFIFHDVDMIPMNDNCLYRCSYHPRHFLTGVSKWNYNLPYPAYYGGVVGFSKDQYEKINGDSNLYFGWGGEDDDLKYRVLNKGYKLVRYPKTIGLYDTMSHKRDKGNTANNRRFKLLKQAQARQDDEGLSTTKYKVTEVVERQLFTRIKAYINMTQILQTEEFNTTENSPVSELKGDKAIYIEEGTDGENSTLVKLKAMQANKENTGEDGEKIMNSKDTSIKIEPMQIRKEEMQQDRGKIIKEKEMFIRKEGKVAEPKVSVNKTADKV